MTHAVVENPATGPEKPIVVTAVENLLTALGQSRVERLGRPMTDEEAAPFVAAIAERVIPSILDLDEPALRWWVAAGMAEVV